MSKTAGFQDYLRAAFNAKPLGMFVAPNWIALGAFGLLGLVNPGLWIIGAGLELGYLVWLVENPRFRRTVDSLFASREQEQWQAKLKTRVEALSAQDAQRFRQLEERCRAVLGRQQDAQAPEIAMQAEGLGRLLWIYLGVLQARQALRQIISDPSTAGKLQSIEARLGRESDEHVRKSLSGQINILRQRLTAQNEGRAKIDFLDAEVARIEEQVELIREQSLLAADPTLVSQRIDEIGATLGGTTQWIREQQKLYGQVEDLLQEAPSIPLQEPQEPEKPPTL